MIQTPSLEKIKKSLQKSEICIIPTDTILGIFANAQNHQAVEEIFLAKKRSKNKPLAIFLPKISQISKYGIETEESQHFAQKNLPGKYTILLKATNFAKTTLSPLLISQEGTIGIRIPNQQDILTLTKEIIICGTSVNISGTDFAKNKIPTAIQPFVSFFFTNKDNNMTQTPSQIFDFSQNQIKKIR